DGMALKKILPPVAFNWASTDSKVKKALTIATDIKGNVTSIDEILVMADAIEAKLKSADKSVIFPQLREAKLKAVDIKMGLDKLRTDITQTRAKIIEKYISQDERKNLEELRKKKDELRRVVDSLPKGAKELEEKEREIVKHISDIEKVIHQLQIALEGMKAQLFAIEKWLNDNKGKLGDKSLEEDFATKVKTEWDNVNAIEQDIAIYTAEIKKERGKIGALSVLSEDQNKRLELKKVEDDERRLFDNFKNRLSQEDSGYLNRVDNLISRLNQHEEEFKKFDARIDAAVDKKAKALTEIIEREKKNLEEYKKEANIMTDDSKELVGKIGYAGFRQVNKLFSDLVLKADVGIVDVAWKQKEEVDKKIGKLREDQAKEIKGVQEEFEFDIEK
ncbi:MAG: hypothetical protein ACPL7I_03800, partial [Myxococcota bacterium]